MAKTIEEIQQVLAGTRSELMNKANVVAVGIGHKITDGQKTDELAVICSVEIKKSVDKLRPKDLIPSQIADVSTDVIPTGPLTIFQNRTDRFRPAPGGVSIGHFQITAGTLGCLVQKNGDIFILSNNHVLANSNEASPGDPILQPGPSDAGRQPQDKIATLSEFVPINFESDGNGEDCSVAGFVATILNKLAAFAGSKTRLRQYRIAAENNKVDCAIAKPVSPQDVIDEILEIGTLSGIIEGVLGMEIKKSGRTTGLTTGTIEQVNVTARVNYGADKVAVFEDQLLAGAISEGGDSGSVVLNQENNVTGLLFAGSSTTTIINRIQNVFSALNVRLS